MIDTEKLYFFFKTNFPLNKDGLDELIASFKPQVVKKGTLLLKEENVENKLRFLAHGVVREYYTNQEKETNINFYTTPQFISDLSSFNGSTKSRKNQECLTKVEQYTLDRTVFHQLLEKYQCGKQVVETSFRQLLDKKERFEYNKLTKSPDELYQIVLKEFPSWLANVPQYHIASFLGITPETLSRIRKRIS